MKQGRRVTIGAETGTLTITEKNGKLQGAMGPTGGYTFAIDPWNGDTLSFAPHGENALPGSLSSAVFTRTAGSRSGEKVQLSQVTLTVDADFDTTEGRAKVKAVGEAIKELLKEEHLRED